MGNQYFATVQVIPFIALSHSA